MAKPRWDGYKNWDAVVVKTLKNCIIDKHRTRKNEVGIDKYEHGLLSDFNNPQQELEGREKWEILQNIIDQLPHLQKYTITLKDIEGYETEDIAKLTQTSIEAVRMNLSRARQKVKEVFLKRIEL
jgi:RNA polymerase sigma-70 factor (ECF subfamily)